MGYWFVALLCLLIELGCVRRAPAPRFHLLTGTCTGACEYYAACKQAGGASTSDRNQVACVAECNEAFTTKESIEAFEMLLCEDAIEFVEGPNGRVPGDGPSSAVSTSRHGTE
jgi:hypothetical protein